METRADEDTAAEDAIARYALELPRYARAARRVEEILRAALRAADVRALVTARAKHPDDLRRKLGRRGALLGLREEGSPLATDLAGCRILVYRPSDRSRAEAIALEALPLAPGDGSVERHAKSSGYSATHLLVLAPASVASDHATVCEVQIVSLARHVFHELEHDLVYKRAGAPPPHPVVAALGRLRQACDELEAAVEGVATATEALPA